MSKTTSDAEMERVTFRVPPELKRRMERLVDEEYRWPSLSALCRDAACDKIEEVDDA